jgi:hypothetical protein
MGVANFILCSVSEKNLSLNLPETDIVKSVKQFKYRLKIRYAQLMFKNISFSFMRACLGPLKRSIIFFMYGVVDILTLKLFKISLISKLFKQK